MMKTLECDVLVVGGGMGGVAAALAAARAGKRVIMLEETRWIVGQMTAQGVSAPDEHPYIEGFGGTRSYYEMRNRIRDYYRAHHQLSETAHRQEYLNPGNAWVSRIPFEPQVGLRVLEMMLQPFVENGQLQIFRETRATAAEVRIDRVVSVTARSGDRGEDLLIHFAYVLDATELGDLLPPANCEYVTGAEGRDAYGEPHGDAEPDPDRVQSFTYTFILEHCPGETHTIARPHDYERWRSIGRYTLRHYYRDRGWVRYGFFEPSSDVSRTFWSYRRLVAQENFLDMPHDIALINWPGNDYAGGNIIDKPAEQQAEILRDAKNFALGFLYWLQTECPRDEGGSGYPELKLRPDLLGTQDGLSMYPYIRESRRIRAIRTVVEQDVASTTNPGKRAATFPDSVGIGQYFMDLHACRWDDHGMGELTNPFQIPLGALLPVRLKNLLPACKNTGTTHVTNGCYRLHPVEWAIGEAAGALAAFAVDQGVGPHQIHAREPLLRAFQQRLIAQSVPLYWFPDVPLDHPAFTATQLLAVRGIMPGSLGKLEFEPYAPLDAEEASAILSRVQGAPESFRAIPVRGEFAMQLYNWLER